VTRHYQVTGDHQLIKSIIVSLDYQCIDLLVCVRLGKNLVIVAGDDHGLDVTRHLDPIVVSVHRKILDVISDPFRTVVLVDRVRVLLRVLSTLPWSVRSRLVVIVSLLMCRGVSMSLGGMLGPWMVRPRGCLGMVMCMVMLMMRGLVMLLLSTLRHILEGCICLLLLLLDNGIDVRHYTIEPRYIRHSVHKEHVVVVRVHDLWL
jgi:hypothetical protein